MNLLYLGTCFSFVLHYHYLNIVMQVQLMIVLNGNRIIAMALVKMQDLSIPIH